MSEFHVEVVELGAIEKHPNADTLGITRIHDGYPVIVRLGEYQPGDRAVYVPVDSVVPTDDPRWSFLEGRGRIKAKRLRGVFSMGLLTQAEPSWGVGRDVAGELRITKYEPPAKGFQGEPRPGYTGDDDTAPEGNVPKYTDIEGLRRYGRLLVPGEEVVITEKLHGENMRAYFDGERLHVGSRTRWKKPGVGGWWAAAIRHRLAEVLEGSPGMCWFGEAHGYTGGFPYGVKGENGQRGASFRVFDVFDAAQGWRYADYDGFASAAAMLGLETAPVLYRGPWDPAIAYELAEGCSMLDPSHVREGVVVRPVHERWDDHVGRVILKLHGEGFLLGTKGKKK
jgi:RNA ligase (TIGR02306 family)